MITEQIYTFSNDKYNSLVIQSEKRRQGLYSTHPNQEGIKINMSAIEDALNMINSASTKEEQQTAIKGALREIARALDISLDEYDVIMDGL